MHKYFHNIGVCQFDMFYPKSHSSALESVRMAHLRSCPVCRNTYTLGDLKADTSDAVAMGHYNVGYAIVNKNNQ